MFGIPFQWSTWQRVSSPQHRPCHHHHPYSHPWNHIPVPGSSQGLQSWPPRRIMVNFKSLIPCRICHWSTQTCFTCWYVTEKDSTNTNISYLNWQLCNLILHIQIKEMIWYCISIKIMYWTRQTLHITKEDCIYIPSYSIFLPIWENKKIYSFLRNISFWWRREANSIKIWRSRFAPGGKRLKLSNKIYCLIKKWKHTYNNTLMLMH
jgi:hypothetical protein